MNPALCRVANTRRTITGLVLSAPAIDADVCIASGFKREVHQHANAESESSILSHVKQATIRTHRFSNNRRAHATLLPLPW